MTLIDATLIDKIHRIVGSAGIVDPSEMAPYLRDWRGRYRGQALAVVRPAATEQVAAIVKVCAEHDVAIVPQGGNTGLVAGATPLETGDCIVLCLSRMTRVRAIDTANDTMTVDAGCTLARIQTEAAAIDRLFPLSLASEGSCQIGGNISTNAGGTAVLRYGNMRAQVLGLEVVLPDGEVWNGLRGLRKDNTGYDLKQLFIGAEGTLGIVTAAVLRLAPALHARATAWVALDAIDAVTTLLERCRAACGEKLTSFELISRSQLDVVYGTMPDTYDPLGDDSPWVVLVEVADSAHDAGLTSMLEAVIGAALEDGLATDAAIPASDSQTQALWHIRHIVSEANVRYGASVSHDISVPISKIGECLSLAEWKLREAGLVEGAEFLYVGHVGDGNIHSIVLFTHEAWAQVVDKDGRIDAIGRIVNGTAVDMGGSLSAEHGIGRSHRDEMAHYKSPVELNLMRAVKNAIDPYGRMNPGKLL
jgi:FAD/FMN-containing dehydrogenase